MDKRIRQSAFLICLGLAIQLVTLHWLHPLAFMSFLVVGCPVTAAGILLYLYSLLKAQE